MTEAHSTGGGGMGPVLSGKLGEGRRLALELVLSAIFIADIIKRGFLVGRHHQTVGKISGSGN